MRIKDIVDMTVTNSSGQRVSLLNPQNASARGAAPVQGLAGSPLQPRPPVVRRQAQRSDSAASDRHAFNDASNSPIHSKNPAKTTNYKPLTRMERVDPIGQNDYQDDCPQLERSHSDSSTTTMNSNSPRTPPTPTLPDAGASQYEDPELYKYPSPYSLPPMYPQQPSSNSPFAQPLPTLGSLKQHHQPIEPGFQPQFDLTLRARPQGPPSPVLPSPSSGNSLPAFGQQFYGQSSYAQPATIGPSEYKRPESGPTYRMSSMDSARDYVPSPHAPPRYSRESRRPTRLDLARSRHSSGSIGTSPVTPDTPDSSGELHPSKERANGRNGKHKYPCPLAKQFNCDSYFTTSGHAARHSKKHTGKKDAKCPECGKRFTRKDNMEQHRRVHYKDKKKQKSKKSDSE